MTLASLTAGTLFSDYEYSLDSGSTFATFTGLVTTGGTGAGTLAALNGSLLASAVSFRLRVTRLGTTVNTAKAAESGDLTAD